MARPSTFDIRLVIALLIGFYGVVITVVGLGFTSDAEINKAAGININLWAGLGMLLLAAGFVVWARVRPIKVEDQDASNHSSREPHQ